VGEPVRRALGYPAVFATVAIEAFGIPAPVRRAGAFLPSPVFSGRAAAVTIGAGHLCRRRCVEAAGAAAHLPITDHHAVVVREQALGAATVRRPAGLEE
jgi:hypothetical protein